MIWQIQGEEKGDSFPRVLKKAWDVAVVVVMVVVVV